MRNSKPQLESTRSGGSGVSGRSGRSSSNRNIRESFPDSTKSTYDNDTRPNYYGNGITSLMQAPWGLDGIYSNNRSKTSNTEQINNHSDNTRSSITKRLFTPNKFTTGPNETHNEHNNGGPITPRILRGVMDNDNIKNVKKSNEKYTSKIHRDYLKT